MKSKQKVKKPIYPYNEWEIVEDSFDVETNLRDETIFTIGNGYIGMRGTFEEGYSGPEGTSTNGTYLNGFYESEPIIYGEEAYGYAKNSQTMLNVTDSKIINLYIGNERFDLFKGKLLAYKRKLDMKNGVLTREIRWESPTGKQVDIKIDRLVLLSEKHLVAISYEVTPLNFDGEISIVSALNGSVQNETSKGDPRAASILSGQVLLTNFQEIKSTLGLIGQKTSNTQFALACAMENSLHTDALYTIEPEEHEQWVGLKYIIKAAKGQQIKLEKMISYYTSKDYAETEINNLAKNLVTVTKEKGFKALLKEQWDFLNNFWTTSDVEIKGDIALQQGIRFNIFHLLQSVGKDGKTNISAKGLTGEGYEGHYFWDTETYIFPFFLYTNPEISRKLLDYRYSILDKARERAKELSHKGALYPWRTINGEETSAYYPAGTAQYHINADIIYAMKKYINATDDMEFLVNKGAEMLFETARLWADLGDYIKTEDGIKFCINGVTGPDEYTAIVNNNVFTNLMAKDHLQYAVKIAALMKEKFSAEFNLISKKIGLNESEISEWQQAAGSMYIPFNEKLGIHPQDDTFLNKAVWDFENTPADKYPLLLHYHPLVIYRHQVLKQADLVLALYLQGDHFTGIEKKRNYDYYEAITTHDSSLSPCIYSIIASEIGYKDKAYTYFSQTARMDLDDINNNVKDGVHTAAMAGTWLAIFSGFAGIREYDGVLYFNPDLPLEWEGYHFKVSFKGRLIDVNIEKNKIAYTLLGGEKMAIYHQNKKVDLEPGIEMNISLLPKLEAVIFDLDGVITDTAEYHYLAWKKLADKLGVPFDREFNEKLKGIGRMESLEIILEQGSNSFSDEEKLALANEKNDYYIELIETITPNEILPGILPLLKELKENNIKIGLASASKNALTVLEKLQIKDLFDYIVDAAKVSKGKPDPEIFMAAADAMNIPYRNCIGVEDASAGITAIKAANMLAIGIGKEASLQEADLVVNDTSDLSLQLFNSVFEAKTAK